MAKEQEATKDAREKEKGGEESKKSDPNDFTVYVLRNKEQENKW